MLNEPATDTNRYAGTHDESITSFEDFIRTLGNNPIFKEAEDRAWRNELNGSEANLEWWSSKTAQNLHNIDEAVDRTFKGEDAAFSKVLLPLYIYVLVSNLQKRFEVDPIGSTSISFNRLLSSAKSRFEKSLREFSSEYLGINTKVVEDIVSRREREINELKSRREGEHDNQSDWVNADTEEVIAFQKARSEIIQKYSSQIDSAEGDLQAQMQSALLRRIKEQGDLDPYFHILMTSEKVPLRKKISSKAKNTLKKILS